jgi:hypothetical protein
MSCRTRPVVIGNVEVDLTRAVGVLLFSLLFFPQGLFRAFRSDEGHNAIHPTGLQFIVRQRANDLILLLGSFGVATGWAGGGAVVWVPADLVRRAHGVTSHDLGREALMGIPGLEVEEGAPAASEPVFVSRPSIRPPK